ncbi:MAG: ATP-binding protein [Porticoccaceae bacterium]
MGNRLGILLVDDKAADRALMEVVLRQQLPAAQLQIVADALTLGEILAGGGVDAALIDADLQWYDAFALVKKLKAVNPECLIIVYSNTGIQALTPEIADLGLTAFYRKDSASLLEIPRVFKERLLTTAPTAKPPAAELNPESSPEQPRELPAFSAADSTENGFTAEMFHAISHDLKQPLQIFCRQTDLLEKRFIDQLDASGQQLVGNMKLVAAQMLLLLDSILAYYQPQAGDAPEEVADIGEVVRSVIAVLQPSLDDISGTVVIDNLPRLQVNRGQLTQVIQNLLTNAIKFRGNDSPKIKISALDVTDNWLFTVEDNGIGIPEDKVDDIFVLFKRLHSHSEYSGSGLGLALCKRIVEDQGGKIWARAKPGQGTAIHFTLPKQRLTSDEKQNETNRLSINSTHKRSRR